MEIEIIKSKIGNLLHKDILDCFKLTNGSCNDVYKIVTSDKNYVLRIFSSRSWPEEGKLGFINDKLIENNIFSAKNVFITRDDPDFEKGFMVQEFLDGYDVSDVIDEKISEEDYYEKIGKLLKKIHGIKIQNYGYIGTGIASHDKFSDFMETEFNSMWEDIKKLSVYDAKKYEEIKTLTLNELSLLNDLPSVLIHADVSFDNVMLVNDELVLIDWDNALSSNWIHEYSVMTYWIYWGVTDESLINKRKKIFLDSYGTGIDINELRHFELIFHLFLSFKLMTWYKESTDEFSKVIRYMDRVYSLLKEGN